jgi:phage gp29-like protein
MAVVQAQQITTRQAGVPLSMVGGLPARIDSARKPQVDDANARDLDLVRSLSPSLAAVLRPQAAYRWLLPYLASLTPTYVESVLRGALAGNHVQAWELFSLMMDTDPEISSCVGEYVDGVALKRLVVEPYREDEDDEPSAKAEEKHRLVSVALRGMRPDPASDEDDLTGIVRDVLFGRFHGQSVVEVDWFSGGQLNRRAIAGLGRAVVPRAAWWVHPVCYAWDMDGRLGLRVALESQLQGLAKMGALGSGVRPDLDYSMVEPPAWSWITSQPRPSALMEFPANKFLISVIKAQAGPALQSCCLRPLAWWWVASNFCGDWLLNYAQLFGVPMRIATHTANLEEPKKAEIRQMLQSMGSNTWGLFPEGTKVDLLKAGAEGANSPQAFLFNFADSQKRKVILRQTMTGGSHDSMGKGGGKAFGEVEKDKTEQCIQSGANYVASVLNTQLIPYILAVNYPGDGAQDEAPACKLIDDDTGDLAEAQTLQVVAQLVDVPETYIRRRFAIPKPGPDDRVAGTEAGVAGAGFQAQQDQQQDQLKLAHKQADAQQAQADEMRRQREEGPEEPEEPGQRQEQPDEEEELEGRRGVRILAESAASVALAETVAPLRERVAAIARVADRPTRARLLRKLLADLPHVAAALRHDGSLAKAVTPGLVDRVVAGMATKAKGRE